MDVGASSAPNCNDGKRVNADAAAVLGCSSTKKYVQRHQFLRLAPKSDAAITPLTINLSEFFTSTRLSLNSHEGRLGNHAAEELFNSMLHASNKG